MCFKTSTSKHSAKLTPTTTPQAYDGHMNLILSDVEETIMIVDVEDAPEGTINVGFRCT